MRVKIVGFRVGVARPTYNKTMEIRDPIVGREYMMLGSYVWLGLRRSDFLSIRRVD